MLTAEGVSPTSTVLVPFAPSSVAVARRALAEDLDGRGVPHPVVDDALLVLSELLSNALRHARPLPSGRVRVRWAVTRNGVEIEVTDGGAPTSPLPRPPSPTATGGRGLGIVGELTRDWGVHQDGGRTTVWAVVTTRRPVDAGGSRAHGRR